MSSDRIVYGAYAIGTLCALGGVLLGWRGHVNDKKHKAERAARRRTSTSSNSSPNSPRHRVNKRKLRQFMKKMPSEAQFVAMMETTTQKFPRGMFYDEDVLRVRAMIMEVGRNEDLRPYSLDCTLDCLEWLSSYHSHLASMTLQAGGGESPDQMKEAVMILQDECRMELEPFWDIVNGRSAESTSVKERLRVWNILVAMASSQKWFERLSECYHKLRDLDPEDYEPDRHQGGYHMQQIINLFLTAPALGEWADLAKFSDLIEQMRKDGGMKKKVVDSVFAHQGHLQLMLYVGRYLDDLPQTPPDPSTLKDAFIPILNLRKKLTKGTSTDTDLQAKFDEQLDEWVTTDQDHKPQILLEGACAHLLGITQRSLLSGAYDKENGKIFAVLDHASGARKETIKAARVNVTDEEPDKGDNFWRGTMTVAAHTAQHKNYFEFALEFELGDPTSELGE